MRSLYPDLAVAGLLALCLATPIPGLATAGTPIPIVDDGPVVLSPGSDQAATGVCVLQPAPRASFAYVLNAQEVYRNVAWRIPFASCPVCPAPQILQINSMAFRIRWFGVCSAAAEVSIVGATGPSTCRVPDTTIVLCPPVTYTIDNPSGMPGVIYTLPLSPGCCVTGEAFALVRFSGFENCLSADGLGPGIYSTTAVCTNCDQFYTSTVVPGLTDWCSPPFPPNSLWIQLDADCCTAVGTERSSWGKVKALYR